MAMDMQGGEVRRIGKEVLRAVTSPFAICLKDLYDVAKDVQASSILLWAEANACQIEPMASMVLEGLELWPFTLDLIKTFAPVIPFRDALLRQNAFFLPALLERACNAENQHAVPTELCVRILSAPLPSSCPTPAKVPLLLSHLLEQATASPCPASVRQLYLVAKGIHSALLELIPYDKIAHFQAVVLMLLKEQHDHSIQLLCLAALARLVSVPKESSLRILVTVVDSATIEAASMTSDSDILQPSRRLFSTHRVSKTIRLVVLRAIMCSTSCGLAMDSETGCMELSKVILDAIDNHHKKLWAHDNAPLVHKLLGRASRTDINPCIRLEVLHIVVSLAGLDSVTEESITFVQDQIQARGVFWDVPHASGSGSTLETFAPIFRDDFIRSQIFAITELAMGAQRAFPEPDIIHYARCGHQMLECLKKLSAGSEPRVRATLLSMLASEDFRGSLDRLLEHTAFAVPQHRPGDSFCIARLAESRKLLRQELIILFLAAALSDDASSDVPRLDPSIARAFLHSLRCHSSTETTCSAFQSHRKRAETRVQVMPVTIALDEPVNSRNWRVWLEQELCDDSKDRHALIVRRFGEICRDLEARCENTEKPYKEQQAIACSLQARLHESEQLNANLKAEVEERDHQTSALETNNAHLARNIETADQKLQKQSDNFEVLQQELSVVKQQASKAVKFAKDAREQRQLETLAAMAAKDELVEQQANDLASSQMHVRNLKVQNETFSTQFSTANEKCIALEQIREQQEVHLAQLERSNSENEGKLSELNRAKSRLSESLRSLNYDSDAYRTEATRKNTEDREEVARLRSEVEKSHGDREMELQKLNDTFAAERTTMELSISKLQQELEDTHTEARQRQDDDQTKMADLRRTVDKLRAEKEERTREFAEAKDLSTKLMAVMGSKPLPSIPATPEPRALSTGGQLMAGYQGKNGRRPKRPKTTHIPEPSPQHCGSSVRFKCLSAGVPGPERQPLEDLGLSPRLNTNTRNMRATEVHSDQAISVTDPEIDISGRNPMDDFNDLSFAESVVFTARARENPATPKPVSSGAGSDDTTVDS